MGPKINVKERFTDGEIDLSMSDIEEVPVKEIAQLRKAFSLDLSNNRLTVLPKNFVTLTHITKLDLSKNELKNLPEDFGSLNKLKYLDLYQNQLQHLPLSFSKLIDLKWLDLKDNPLVPTVAKIAGPCLDTKQCQNCARDVVNFFVKLEQQVNSELEARNKTRQKQLEINQQKRQEEKKGKKKKKQKQKQETLNVDKNKTTLLVLLVSKQTGKDNNKKNDKVISRTTKTSSSFIRKVFIAFLLISIGLFILTSIKSNLTQNVESYSYWLYNQCLEMLPSDWRIYGVQCGNIICDIHKKVGNLTLDVVNFINDNVISKQMCNDLISNFRDIIQNVVSKIKDVYNDIMTA